MSKKTVKQKETNEPFLQRVIEHWLDSVNELSYQSLFCEWLSFQGYAVKYEIKNTNFEQGKDVVAVDFNGAPCAYQLKGGNINLHRWRTEVKPEVEVLIEIPIAHPNIDQNKKHISFLVTNGNIDDSVRADINGLNNGRWKNTPLRVLTRGDLLQGFQEIAVEVLPQDARAYKTLSNLIFADGTSFVDLSEIFPFLCQILGINEERAKEKRKRDVSAAILYMTMITGPYREKENHVSVIRVMTLLLSLIFYLVDRYNLAEKYWLKSYNLVWGDMLSTAKKLELEVESKGLAMLSGDTFDKIKLPQTEINLIPFRNHGAVSMIFSLKVSEVISQKNIQIKDILQKDIIDKYRGSIFLYGEGGLLPLILLALMLTCSDESKEEGVSLVEHAISEIIKYNGRNAESETGLLPPYFDLNFVLNFVVNRFFGVPQEPFEHQSKQYSHYLKPIIEMMARLNQKDFISDQWREISFIYFEEFVFDNKYDYYLMQSEKGECRTEIPKKEKSWKDLIDESNSSDGRTLPDSIKRFPEFIPFFLSVFPHRLDSDVLGFLFQRLKERGNTN